MNSNLSPTHVKTLLPSKYTIPIILYSCKCQVHAFNIFVNTMKYDDDASVKYECRISEQKRILCVSGPFELAILFCAI